MADATTILRTRVLGPGECFVLPASSTVTSVTASGSITATSTCGNLPTPGAYKCWRFLWEDTDDDTAHNDTFFTGIKIGDTTYNLEGAPVAEANSYDNGADFLAQAIPVSTPAGLVTGIISGGGEATDPKCLVIQIPESFGQPILYWSNPGFESGAFLGVDGEEACACPA